MNLKFGAGQLNSRLQGLCENDKLYHLGISMDSFDLTLLDGVLFCIVMGTESRVIAMCEEICKIDTSSFSMIKLSNSDRYVVYRSGPALVVSHGIGAPSAAIVLHEVMKLMHYCGVLHQSTFLRVGTCGGLGAKTGELILTTQSYNDSLEPGWTVMKHGKKYQYAAVSTDSVVEHLSTICTEMDLPFKTGNTLCSNCFYEGQSRLDGLFETEYDEASQDAWLRSLVSDYSIQNIEMESGLFLAICGRARVQCGVICLALVNRFEEDQVSKYDFSVDSILGVVAKFIESYVQV